MNFRKFLTAGFVGGIVIAIISLLVDRIVQVFWPYDVLSLGGMRAAEDPFMLLFFLHYWVISFAMAYVWREIHVFFPGDAAMHDRRFGLLVWIMAGLPSSYVVYTSMNYPLGFTVSSVVGSFAYMVAAGAVVVRLME
ncbi:MAG: hypothetical protein ABH834_00415 [Candidatus Altiarchaeota archaeon]